MGGFFAPSLDGFVDRLDSRLGVLAGRQIIDLAPIQSISDADLDLIETVQDVELGQRQALDAARSHRLAHQNRVEPAAASRPAGHDAEFLATLAERSADLVDLLGGKRTGAYASGIGLANSEHISDRPGAQSRPGRGLSGDRVRRRDEWIGAVVDVEQRSLRAFE